MKHRFYFSALQQSRLIRSFIWHCFLFVWSHRFTFLLQYSWYFYKVEFLIYTYIEKLSAIFRFFANVCSLHFRFYFFKCTVCLTFYIKMFIFLRLIYISLVQFYKSWSNKDITSTHEFVFAKYEIFLMSVYNSLWSLHQLNFIDNFKKLLLTCIMSFT